MKQESLLSHAVDPIYQDALQKARAVLSEMDEDDAVLLLSRMMLDEIKVMINKFPVQRQQEMVAILADDFMEQWSKEEK